MLKEWRLKKGLTQEEVSKRIGVHRTYYGMIERGIRTPSIKTMLKIADVLGVDPDPKIFTQKRDLKTHRREEREYEERTG